MTVRFLSPASDELIHSIKYYEEQRVGLGSEFLKEVEHVIELINLFPNAWPIYLRRNKDDEIIVAAIMDMRCDPDSGRLNNE